MLKKYILFLIVGLALGGLYLWGNIHNRYLCGALWVICPLVFCLFGSWIEKGEEWNG